MWKIAAALIFAAFLCACTPASTQANKEPPKRFQLHGQVVRVDPQGKTAAINGDKIEGWMDAMSMEYPVKDAQDLSTLHADDCIDATVFVQGTDYWIGEIKHDQAAPGACIQKK